MKMTVNRLTTTRDSILGRLDVNGVDECWTLENRDPAIPLGTYSIRIYDSPHSGHPVPLLEDVPNRSYVEIHSGNRCTDSRGCLLVGQEHTTDSLSNSRLAFAHLFPQIKQALDTGDTVEITIQ